MKILPVSTTDPAAWAAGNRAELRSLVATDGAVLVRGLGIANVRTAANVSHTLIDSFVVEREGFAPRDSLERGMYSSTKWPSDQPMCMHHELSYVPEVPSVLAFTCLRAPDSGGVTALADSQAVLDSLDADVVARFSEHGWQLVRHYNPLVGVSLADAFGSADKDVVEAYCESHRISFQWGPEGSLRTTQTRPAVVRHPASGRLGWFNQIAFLNEWTMDPDVRDYLTMALDGGLPFTTLAGDGTPLDRETVDAINAVYDAHTIREPWQDGDLMLVDNIRMAHAVEPYKGSREIVVAMGEPITL
uniref:Putative SyrP-like protein n=1 Tax=uncultured bacterium esnapd2 TaxID=1366601 RepID=S5TKB4_9BACT|nr:putative SyrP-like protein [uncultured bacterium esnapd2]